MFIAERKSLLFSALLVIAGEVVYGVAQVFHAESGTTASDVFASYANSPIWAIVHAAQFTGSTITALGLVSLFFALNVSSGVRGHLSRFGAASAIAVIALNGALYAVDGVALKQAVDAWVSAPASQQPAFYAVVEGIRGVEWGMRSYVGFVTGLTLVLFAVVIVWTRTIPVLAGYVMGLSGLLYIASGYGWGSGYTSVSAHFFVNPYLIHFSVAVWSIWLLINGLRMSGSAKGAGSGNVPG
jgi:hypothetical protein